MKPRIFIFSTGEATTDLCKWALERYGWEPILWQDKTLLWEKLKRFYNEPGEVLYRVDADIIPTKNSIKMTELSFRKTWFWQSAGWSLYNHDLGPISLTAMHRKAIDIAKKHIDKAQNELRPETYIWRLPEFYNPRVCRITDIVAGIHGYGQNDRDYERIRVMKALRNQEENYDWKLVDKMRAL